MELFHKIVKPSLSTAWVFRCPLQSKTLILWRCKRRDSFGRALALNETMINEVESGMKKLLKYRKSTHEDFRHIPFVRIRAFASGEIDFTEKENAHFDLCRLCRLKLIADLKNLAPTVIRTMCSKAA